MAIKAETIAQFEGFGNLTPKLPTEYHRSVGFTKSMNGIAANKSFYEWWKPNYAIYTQFSVYNDVNMYAEGYSRQISSGGGSQPYLFSMSADGMIMQSLQGVGTPEMVYQVNKNSSHLSSGGIGGLIVDQKKRLLYPGQRYLGAYDPSVSEGSISFTATNGSNALVATSGTFLAADGTNKVIIRVFDSGGVILYYRLNNYTDATHMSIFGTWGHSTGTFTGFILRSWNDYFKDFGTNFTANSEGYSAFTPTETYEDTVLFGRGSNITSLNTVTDTITTDASPAFTMPAGFDCLAIHKGSNGLLIASNFKTKGVLILWDNFSDRSIAPWIQLQDRICSVCKYNGGWLVITTREIFYTNGYSITPLIDSFLDSQVTTFQANLRPQSSLVIENDLYCFLGIAYNGKRRAGLHRINLESKLAEYIPRVDMDQYNERMLCLFYGAGNGAGYIYGGTSSANYQMLADSPPTVATYITNPIGKGDNFKHAEALKVNLGISSTHYNGGSFQFPYAFRITAKISPMMKQMNNYFQLKVAMTQLDQITVDETFWKGCPVGDEVEFIAGTNAGYSRNVLSKTGAGTATAVYTLDRALPTLDSNSGSPLHFITPFQLIKSKAYTGLTEMPEVWFDIKNKVKGKKFMIKLDIEGANVPVELRPMLFIYDDLGAI